MRKNVYLSDNEVADRRHWSDTRREAGLAAMLARIPRDKALSYWFAENSCKESVQLKVGSPRRRLGFATVKPQLYVDLASIWMASTIIEYGQRRVSDQPAAIFGQAEATPYKDIGSDRTAPVSCDDILELPGFARFVVRVERMHPGAIKSWLSGRIIAPKDLAPQPAKVDDFWLILEDKYEEQLDANGNNKAAASRWYLAEIVRSSPSLAASTLKRVRAQRERAK